MAIVYIGIGSNLSDRHQNLLRALELLSEKVTLGKVSSIYETEPVGYDKQPLFLNLVCKVETELSPQLLLKQLKEIERGMGRKASFRNAPRVIDLDILFYDHIVMERNELTIPHPGLTERQFVLVPLEEIAPGLVHPVKKKTVKQLRSELSNKSSVIKYDRDDKVLHRRRNVSSIR